MDTATHWDDDEAEAEGSVDVEMEEAREMVRDHDPQKATLLCIKCRKPVQCDKCYFGGSFFLAPHYSDPNYTFTCKRCAPKPLLVHLDKKWLEVALCALTTFEMMAGWCLFWDSDLMDFIDSHFEEIAPNKERGENETWKVELIDELFQTHTKLINHEESGEKLCFYLPRRGKAPLHEAIFAPEKILESKKQKGEMVYLVKWQGFSEQHATWEDSENLREVTQKNSLKLQDLLENFEKTREEASNQSLSSPLDEGLANMKVSPNRSKRKLRPLSGAYVPPDPQQTTRKRTKSGNSKKVQDLTSDPPISPPSPIYEPTTTPKKSSGKKKVEEKEEKGEISTAHHTYKVPCSTCQAKVPVTDLGITIVSPTCTNWILECANCTGDVPRVVYSQKSSFREVTRRVLFALHVLNPEQEQFTVVEIIKFIREHAEITGDVDVSETPERSLPMRISGSITKDTYINSLVPGSGKYQYVYKPKDSAPKQKSANNKKTKTNKQTESDLNLSSTPPPHLRYLVEEQLSPPNSPVVSPPHQASSSFPPPPSLSPSPSSSSSSSSLDSHLPFFAPTCSSSLTTPSTSSSSLITPSTPSTPSSLCSPPTSSDSSAPATSSAPAPSTSTALTSSSLPTLPPPPPCLLSTTENASTLEQSILKNVLLPDIFISWMGEEAFGFVRINLNATLKELRSEIERISLTENEKFCFVYKTVYVRPAQEETMFVRECVVEKDEGFYLQMKHVA